MLCPDAASPCFTFLRDNEHSCGQADGASSGQAMSIASFSDLMSRDGSGDGAQGGTRDPLQRAAEELLQAREREVPCDRVNVSDLVAVGLKGRGRRCQHGQVLY